MASSPRIPSLFQSPRSVVCLTFSISSVVECIPPCPCLVGGGGGWSVPCSLFPPFFIKMFCGSSTLCQHVSVYHSPISPSLSPLSARMSEDILLVVFLLGSTENVSPVYGPSVFLGVRPKAEPYRGGVRGNFLVSYSHIPEMGEDPACFFGGGAPDRALCSKPPFSNNAPPSILIRSENWVLRVGYFVREVFCCLLVYRVFYREIIFLR